MQLLIFDENLLVCLENKKGRVFLYSPSNPSGSTSSITSTKPNNKSNDNNYHYYYCRPAQAMILKPKDDKKYDASYR